MSEKKVTCPECSKNVVFKRDSKGRWVGTLAGGGVGAATFWGIGMAGTIFSIPVAMGRAVTIGGAIVGAALGNRAGKSFDDSQAKCPSCDKSMVL